MVPEQPVQQCVSRSLLMHLSLAFHKHTGQMIYYIDDDGYECHAISRTAGSSGGTDPRQGAITTGTFVFIGRSRRP